MGPTPGIRRNILKAKPLGSTTVSKSTKLASSATAMGSGKKKAALRRIRHNEFVSLLAKQTADDRNSSFGNALGSFEEMVGAIDNLQPCHPQLLVGSSNKKSKRSSGELKRSHKSRADSVDIARYQALMSIPEFASDPLAAIEQHLLRINKKKEKGQAMVQ